MHDWSTHIYLGCIVNVFISTAQLIVATSNARIQNLRSVKHDTMFDNRVLISIEDVICLDLCWSTTIQSRSLMLAEGEY